MSRPPALRLARRTPASLGEPSVAAILTLLTGLAGTIAPAHPLTAQSESPMPDGPLLIAHRGASAYAPEHTLEAYRLGIEQGADLIEPDLQITRDGVLVALHDLTLERTTNVAELFPERARRGEGEGRSDRRWYVVDFTLEELRTLDAGSWFGEEFAGARIPTFREVAELALEAGVGLIPETKAPEVYRAEGFDMVALLLKELEALGLDRRGARPGTPVVVQSFSPESLRALQATGNDLERVLLVSREMAEEWMVEAGLDEAATFADGLGPSKRLLIADAGAADRAHARGLTLTPYTFRAREPDGFDTVEEEMAWFICELGVAGLFTDNPDLFPRHPDCTDLAPPRAREERGR